MSWYTYMWALNHESKISQTRNLFFDINVLVNDLHMWTITSRLCHFVILSCIFCKTHVYFRNFSLTLTHLSLTLPIHRLTDICIDGTYSCEWLVVGSGCLFLHVFVNVLMSVIKYLGKPDLTKGGVFIFCVFLDNISV